MRILGAKLRDFRNLRETELEFAPRVDLLLGPNGQGKTNLLEALAFVALGRSHRTARADEMIRLGADHLDVSLLVEEEGRGRTRFEYALQRGGGRRLRVDGQVVASRAELIGRFACVVFDPATVGLVGGGPERRRRFVDQGLAMLDRPYLEALQGYVRALRHKSHLLREIRRGRLSRAGAAADLGAWNEQLARRAAAVCRGRAAYAGLIGPSAAAAHRVLTGSEQALEFAYRPRLRAARREVPEAQLARDIREEIDYIGEEEMRRGRPLAGPHLDDFEVRLDGLDLRTFGSQGETRTAAVSLILAQSDVVYGKMKVRPVLFFDDIFSELDEERARRLREAAVREHQVFVATARADDVAGWDPGGLRAWRVTGGRLEPLSWPPAAPEAGHGG